MGGLARGPAVAQAVATTTSSVTIAGDLQSEAGCSGDWDPSCATTHLAYSADDDVWQGTWTIPAGAWSYKAALNDGWTENYGQHAVENGTQIPLNLGGSMAVKFYYDDKTHWVTDNHSSVIATVAGDFQSELGCPVDWSPDCLRAWLQDLDGDGNYTFATTGLPAGAYSAKVAIDESWTVNYGQGGVFNGTAFDFTVPADGARVTFTYAAGTHRLTIVSNWLFVPLVRR